MIQKNENLPTKVEVEQYQLLNSMLDSVCDEIKDLSKKKQDQPLNKFKVKALNKILIKINDLLKNEPAMEFLELLDDESLPTNSDASLVLVHYKTAMYKFKQKYYKSKQAEEEELDLLGKPSYKTELYWDTKD